MRAVLFRFVEKSWGTRIALAVSTVFFVLAHLPGDQINGLGIVVTAVAALAFSGAYMLTRRLWLPIGMHFAWNFLLDGVFSVAVSGHEAKGWFHGVMTGPTWLSGGAYGIEASAVTLVIWSLAAAGLLLAAWRRGQVFLRPVTV